MNRFVPMATTTYRPLMPYTPQPLMVYSGHLGDPVDIDGDGSEGCDAFGEFDEYGYIDGNLGAFGGVAGRSRRRKKLQAKIKKAKAQGKTSKAKKLQYRLDKLEAKMRLKGDPGIKGAKKAPAKKKPATKAEKAKAKKEEEAEDREESAEEAEDEKHEKEDPSVAAAPEAASVPDASEPEGGGMNKALLIGGVVAVGALAGFFLLRKKD
jgi:hypothetical protein